MNKTIMMMILGCMICISNVLAQAVEDKADTFQKPENMKKVAQAGFQFLKIGVGARSTGMGEAAVTHEGNAATIFYNPAGITTIENVSVFYGYTDWFADISHQAFAAAYKLKNNWGYIGIGAVAMNYGDIEGTVIDGSSLFGYRDIGMIEVSEYAIGLTYGYRFSERFGLGVNLKYCGQDLYAKEMSIAAIDVGTLYNVGWKGIRIGMAIRHFSKDMKYVYESFQLPLTFNIGFEADLLSFFNVESDVHKATLHFEGVNPRDYSERMHTGVEYWFNNMVGLRAGYKFNYDEEGLSFGGSVRYHGIEMGYAYADFGPILGMINRLSVSTNF